MGIMDDALTVAQKMLEEPPKTAAIILAGGSGSRMAQTDGVPKQRLLLCGEPMLVHAIRAFEDCDCIHEIILVSRKEDMQSIKEFLLRYSFKKLKKIVSGGTTRRASALRGVEARSDDVKYVAIHDACRCLITPEQIRSVMKEAYFNKAACAGTPVVDTLKKVRPAEFVEQTPDRSQYWAAQTPQAFEVKLYLSAAYTALQNHWDITDDSSMVERLGQKVKMVDCGRANIKVTYPCDLIMAEAILLQRSRNEGKQESEETV